MSFHEPTFSSVDAPTSPEFSSIDTFEGEPTISRRALLTGGLALGATTLLAALGINRAFAKEPTMEELGHAADYLAENFLHAPWVGAEIQWMKKNGKTEKKTLLKPHIGMALKLLPNDKVQVQVCEQEPDGAHRWHCISKIVPVSSIPVEKE